MIILIAVTTGIIMIIRSLMNHNHDRRYYFYSNNNDDVHLNGITIHSIAKYINIAYQYLCILSRLEIRITTEI